MDTALKEYEPHLYILVILFFLPLTTIFFVRIHENLWIPPILLEIIIFAVYIYIIRVQNKKIFGKVEKVCEDFEKEFNRDWKRVQTRVSNDHKISIEFFPFPTDPIDQDNREDSISIEMNENFENFDLMTEEQQIREKILEKK